MYCSVEIDVCEMLVQAYEKETGTKVAMTRKSSGETFAQIKAIEKTLIIFFIIFPLIFNC